MTPEEKLAHYDELLQQVEKLKHTQLTLSLVEGHIRRVAPAWCCDHDQPPCLTCGLEWLIENARTSRPAPGMMRGPQPELRRTFRLLQFVAPRNPA